MGGYARVASRPIYCQNSSYIPFSFNFLCERLTTGVYWAIFDSYKESGNEEKFARYNGHLFEKYTAQLLKEIHERSNTTDEDTFLTDAPFYIGKQEYKTPDAVLIGDDCIILVEATASRFKAYETIARGNPEAFNNDCEKIIFNKVDELDRFIKLLRSDRVSINSNKLDSSKFIYPIVATIEEIPPIPPINDFLRQEIANRKLLDFPDLAPLSIISVEDIEDVNSRRQLQFKHGLDEWHSSGDFPYVSFSSFLQRRFDELSLSDDSMVSKVFRKVIDETTLSLFGLDFDEIQKRALNNQ
jgi:hypothetical protein